MPPLSSRPPFGVALLACCMLLAPAHGADKVADADRLRIAALERSLGGGFDPGLGLSLQLLWRR